MEISYVNHKGYLHLFVTRHLVERATKGHEHGDEQSQIKRRENR